MEDGTKDGLQPISMEVVHHLKLNFHRNGSKTLATLPANAKALL